MKISSGLNKLISKILNFFNIPYKQTWLYRRFRIFYKVRFKLYPILKRQLTKTSPINIKKNKLRILVPVIETSHYTYYKLLILSKALEMRGAEILILTCGSILPGCEIKSIKSKVDPCMNCRVNSKNLLPLFGLNTKSISDYIDDTAIENIESACYKLQKNFESPCIYKGIDIYHMVNDSTIRYFYGNVPLKNTIEYIEIQQKYIKTAIIGIEVTNQIHREWSPNITFGFMDCYADYAPYHEIQEKNKGQRFTVNINPFNYHALQVNQQELYKNNNRFERWMKQRNNKLLNEEERKVLNEFIKNRVHGNSHSKDLAYFDESNLNSFLKDLDPSKRNIALFSNIYWDVGVSELQGIFSGVIDWVIKTAEIVAKDKNCHLYIKPHPAEVYDSATSLKGVADFVKENFSEWPENITILYPEMKIKTYDMFDYLDLGILYNGTLGLEMMLDNKPSVICAEAPYSNIGIANEPKSLEDYKDMILGRKDLIYPEKRLTELFAYFYFIKTCIPWNLTKQTYGNNFESFSFNSLEDIKPGKDIYLDHLCNSILNPNETVIEGWPGKKNDHNIIVKD